MFQLVTAVVFISMAAMSSSLECQVGQLQIFRDGTQGPTNITGLTLTTCPEDGLNYNCHRYDYDGITNGLSCKSHGIIACRSNLPAFLVISDPLFTMPPPIQLQLLVYFCFRCLRVF